MSNKSALCALLLVAFVFSTPMSLFARQSSTTETAMLAATNVVDFEGQGNVTCASLNASTDSRFAHMNEDFEFKIDPPAEDTFPLDGSPGIEFGTNGGQLLGGMENEPNPNMFLEVNLLDELTMDSFKVLWNSTSNITYLVSAVIVKGGNLGTRVYTYEDLSTGDSGPFTVTGGGNAISHLAFCFEPFTAPSAAKATITGRVTDSRGRGIHKAVVKITSMTGETREAKTNKFGYYRLNRVEIGQSYIITVSHKSYTFVSGSGAPISVTSDMEGVDFTASN